MRAMARRARAERADILHLQWLPVQYVDGLLLPRDRPLVLTAHDVLPREPRAGQLAAQKRLYHRVDAIVAHSDHGRDRLVTEADVPHDKITVIPHGAFTQLADLAAAEPAPSLPPEVGESGREVPVVLFFGLLREYKGLDVLLDAWSLTRRAGIAGELWIAGMPRMDTRALHASARAAGGVRFVERFVTDPEAAALLARADVVVLPYREIEQSGVLFSAMGMGKAIVLSAVGGFPEVAARGAAALVPHADPGGARDDAEPPARRPRRTPAAAGRGPVGRRDALRVVAGRPAARGALPALGRLTARPPRTGRTPRTQCAQCACSPPSSSGSRRRC